MISPRTALLGSVFFGLTASALLFASAATAADSEAVATANSQSDSEVEGIVVTGSRIPRPNLEQPAPVSVLSQTILQNSGTVSLGDVIAQLPALSANGTPRSNSNSFGTAGGLSFADLRNLGTSRTLVLVDGKRHVAGDPGSAAVDLSSIPPALVDHVEIVTGGASAIYGSDAMAGVVNIILKKNFEGIQGEVQTGSLEREAGRDYNADITVGHSFAGGRGHAALTLLWDKSDGLTAKDIPSLRNYGTVVNPADIDPVTGGPKIGDGIPDRLLVPNVLSEYLDENSVLLAYNVNTFALSPLSAFTNGGTPIPQQVRIADNSSYFGEFAGPCPTCFATEDYLVISPKTQRYGAAFNGSYDVTNNVRFTLDAKYISNTARDFVQPSFTFGDFAVAPDNAFITPAIQSALNTLGPDDIPLIGRFMSDFGNRSNINKRETYRVVAGLEGKFDAGFADMKWDASFNYGTTRNHITENGVRISGNFAAAIDSVIDPVTGRPACRINVPSAQDPTYTPPDGVLNAASCVPYNPFGQQNTPASIAYSTVTLHEFQALEQKDAQVNLSFDTSRFFKLPGGPVAIAAGAEWRQESSVDRQDPLIVQGLTENAQTPDSSGGFDVYEGYIEVFAPIIMHKPWIDEFSLDGAVRTAHYSTVGSTDAWKFSGTYAPIPDVKFRGTYSKAVRAPNITEAFLPPSGTFFTVSDPCDHLNIDANVNRRANCIAQNPVFGNNFVANDNESPQGTISGNPDLTPEESTSYTVGGVFQPRFWPSFSMTIDYYNITIKNAITQIDAQDILDNCYDSASGLDATYCSLFTRDSTNNINFIKSTYINASALQTDGIELQANYNTDIGRFTEKWGAFSRFDGRLTASLDLNYLFHLRNFPFQDNPSQVHILEGTVPYPKARFLTELTYTQGPWSFTWQSRYVSKSTNYNKDPSQADFIESINVPFIPDAWYNNLVVHYNLPVHSGKVDLYAGVNNIADITPYPSVVAGNPTGADGSALYDLGRYVFVGARARF